MLFHVKKREFVTSFSKEKTIAKIRERLPKNFFSQNRDCEFLGYVTEDSFKICKNLRYNMPAFVRINNSFQPIAHAKVETSEKGAKVTLALRMNILVAIFMFLIEILILAETVFGLLYSIFSDFSEGMPFFLLGALFFFLIEGLLYLSFSRPAKRLSERIEEILSF